MPPAGSIPRNFGRTHRNSRVEHLAVREQGRASAGTGCSSPFSRRRGSIMSLSELHIARHGHPLPCAGPIGTEPEWKPLGRQEAAFSYGNEVFELTLRA